MDQTKHPKPHIIHRTPKHGNDLDLVDILHTLPDTTPTILVILPNHTAITIIKTQLINKNRAFEYKTPLEWCLTLLRKTPEKIDRKPGFSIYTESDMIRLVQGLQQDHPTHQTQSAESLLTHYRNTSSSKAHTQISAMLKTTNAIDHAAITSLTSNLRPHTNDHPPHEIFIGYAETIPQEIIQLIQKHHPNSPITLSQCSPKPDQNITLHPSLNETDLQKNLTESIQHRAIQPVSQHGVTVASKSHHPLLSSLPHFKTHTLPSLAIQRIRHQLISFLRLMQNPLDVLALADLLQPPFCDILEEEAWTIAQIEDPKNQQSSHLEEHPEIAHTLEKLIQSQLYAQEKNPDKVSLLIQQFSEISGLRNLDFPDDNEIDQLDWLNEQIATTHETKPELEPFIDKMSTASPTDLFQLRNATNQTTIASHLPFLSTVNLAYLAEENEIYQKQPPSAVAYASNRCDIFFVFSPTPQRHIPEWWKNCSWNIPDTLQDTLIPWIKENNLTVMSQEKKQIQSFNPNTIKIGTTVHHPTFGKGTVHHIQKRKNERLLRITFEDKTRTILDHYITLKET